MDKNAVILNKSLPIIILVMLFTPACLYADIYKCISDDGTVKYSDQPCGKKYERVADSPSIDDLVARARPYKQPIIDPDRIAGDLIAYSKDIAAGILPDAPYRYHHVYINDERTNYSIYLHCTTEGYSDSNSNRHTWYEINIRYQKTMNNRGYELWLKLISIRLGRTQFSPLTMAKVKNLIKIGPGKWVAQ